MNDVERVANLVMAKVGEKVEPTEEQKANDREVLAAAGPIEQPKKAEEEAKPDLPEPVKRTQKLIEAIHEGHETRKLLIAAKLRRGVEIENELRQAEKNRDQYLDAVSKMMDARLDAIRRAFTDLAGERERELAGRSVEIDNLDLRLVQLRKALDADIRKLDPERKVTA